MRFSHDFRLYNSNGKTYLYTNFLNAASDFIIVLVLMPVYNVYSLVFQMRCIYNIFLLPTKAFFLPFNTYIGICGVKIFLLYSTKTVNSHPNFYQQKVNVTSYISYALIFNHNFFLFLLQNFVTSILVIFLYTLKIFHSEKYNAFWLTKENQCSTATSHLFIYIYAAQQFFLLK